MNEDLINYEKAKFQYFNFQKNILSLYNKVQNNLLYKYKPEKYDIQHYIRSIQFIQIQLTQDLILSFCSPCQKKLYNDIEKKYSLNCYYTNENVYDDIEYFGFSNIFKIQTNFLIYYKLNKPKKAFITVYNIENCKQIPSILKNKVNTNIEIPKLQLNCNFQIKTQFQYYIYNKENYIFLDEDKNKLTENIIILQKNMPYEYYKNALFFRQNNCCYDINNKQFWFSGYKKEDLQNTINLFINNKKFDKIFSGELINGGIIYPSNGLTLQLLTALYLKLPLLPITMFFTQKQNKHNSFQKSQFLNIDKDKINDFFNSYFIFTF